MAQLFDQNRYRDGFTEADGSQLPALELLALAGSGEKEKAALILRLLRQAARKSGKGQFQEFYSIRAVARHFGVPPTTVTRVYDKLKEEGVLTSIWGSKTFIEPREINRDIRVKAIIGLPASRQLFAAVRNYRMFFVAMQDMLWKHGFTTRLLFYEPDELGGSNLADRLIGYKVDFVIWYGSNFRTTNMADRLIDRGVRVIAISDLTPGNGDHGFYVSRCRAVAKGLAVWKTAGIKCVKVFDQGGRDSRTNRIMIETCLRETGLEYSPSKTGLSLSGLTACLGRHSQAFVFASSDAALQLASEGAAQLRDFLRGHRAMFVEGAIDLLNGYSVGGESDLIEVDWLVAARRIGNRLIEGARCRPDTQIIFEADWIPQTCNRSAIGRGLGLQGP